MRTSPAWYLLPLLLILPPLDAQEIRLERDLVHQGQQSVRISTPTATWIYHLEGAGFASLLDRDRRDWISYRPGNRSAGEFRGSPNLGVFAHPGYTGDRGASTTVERVSPAHVRIRSSNAGGDWITIWDIFPTYARLTVQKAGEPYWFLYEGTPAGQLDLTTGFWGLPDGIRRPLTETWDADIEGPEWVYFGDTTSPRVLFLINHQDDSANDQFWQMESNMTVWGFGRQYRCCGRYLTQTPAQFTVGFAETTDFPSIRRGVERPSAP